MRGADTRCAPDVLSELEQRLAICRNPVNDPTTEQYRQKQVGRVTRVPVISHIA